MSSSSSSRWGPSKAANHSTNVKKENGHNETRETTASTSAAAYTNSYPHSVGDVSEKTDDFVFIDEVEWGPRKDEEGYDTDQETATKPRRKVTAGDDACGCFPPKEGMACLDESCILYACREECRSNCLAGSVCGNKRLQRKEFRDVEVFEAGPKGKGLRLSNTTKPAEKGDILCEYTGKAIREAALGRLFRRYQLDRRLYILALGDGVYVDARQKGGSARYINHSCRPNCKVERWTVRGVIRAAVVAQDRIEPGTELTFDYQWLRQRGRAPTVCHCGTPECRGTLEMPKSLEEQDLQRELEGHWEQITTGKADQTLVNRTVQIFFKDHNEYFLGEVTGYDADKSLHCILYRQDMNEVWEDLSKENWMLLNEEVDKEHFIIAKKVHGRRSTTPTTTRLLTMTSSDGLQQTPVLSKNYLYVQSPIKENFWSMHLIERCQRNCSVQIEAEQMARPPVPPDTVEEVEKYAALDQSLDGTVWKITITGANVPKAYNILQKNIAFLEKKFALEEFARSSTAAHQATQMSTAARLLEANVGPSITDAHEVIFPRTIADAVKKRVQTVRDKCRSVNIFFVASDSKSKQFSKLILEGSLLSDIETAKEHLWQFLLGLCAETEAPMTPNKIYRTLGFLGGALSGEQFQLLLATNNNSSGKCTILKNRRLSLDASEDLNCSPFIQSFESTYRCTVWVQAQDDQGRIDSMNRIVNEATPDAPRKVFFGCKPSEVSRLGAVIQLRASELARGVKYIHLRSDRVYMKLMMKNGGRFFDFVKQVTGALVTIDPMTGDHLRIDGRLSQVKNQMFDESVTVLSETERASLADEVIRLQVECYRDICIREQPWIFGRDWTLNTFSLEDNSESSSPIATIGSLDRRSACQCGIEIAETVANLGLGGNVAGHAAIILYRVISVHPKFSTQIKLREAILACIFLANKAQKMVKWKRLDAVLAAGYATFYPGANFDKTSEEAAVLEERVLATEKEILGAVQYDVFWRDTEWISVAATGSGNLTEAFVQSAFDFAFSGPVLGAGGELWLKYGIEYIFATTAALLKADLSDLLPALSLIPLKVSQAAHLLVESAKYCRTSNCKTPLSPIAEDGNDQFDIYLPTIEQKCVEMMSRGNIVDDARASAVASVIENRYRIIAQQSRLSYAIRGIPREVVKVSVLPVIESVTAESTCRIHVSVSADSDAEDLVLDGSWKAISIADYLLRTKLNDLMALPPAVDISAEARDRPNEQAKACPGLLHSCDILTADGWSGTLKAESVHDGPTSHRLGGKCCIPGKVSEASLRNAGLRWWIPPKHVPDPSGSIPDLFVMRLDPADQVDYLVDLARSIAVDPEAFPMLMSRTSKQPSKCSERCMPISLQRWPPKKVSRKETAKAKQSKAEPMQMGFSAAALQEIQILKQLHGVIPSPQGHPNFLVPVGIALPGNDGDVSTSESASPDENGAGDAISPHDAIFSLFRSNEENAETAARKKSVENCASIVFQPTPFVLQRFMSRKLLSTESMLISDSILVAWFHDILSALVHCHANYVILRTVQLDQIVVDQSGVMKLGTMYRCTVMSAEDRHNSQNSVKTSHVKKKKDDDTNVAGNPYAAPEILLGCPEHSRESDVWAVGCLLAYLLLKKPLFSGKDRASLLTSQYKIVGAPSEGNYEEGLTFPYYSKPPKRYKRGVEKALEHLLKGEASHHQKAIDLISRMLHLDPRKRCTAAEALEHDLISDYFENCRSEFFRRKYVSDWMELKRGMKEATEGDRRLKAAENSRKRAAILIAASRSAAGADDDDLYNMDDFLTSSKPKNAKHKIN